MGVIVRLILVLPMVGALASPARAWGPLGHAIVANLAQRHLRPVAEAEVLRLLAPEHTTSLAAVAGWADALQDDPDYRALWRQTRRQHYVDFRDGDCHFVAPADCREGQCVVAGIAHYVAVLADPTRDDAERRQALKFVVHFVGDIHQPLHAGYRDDRGGNAWRVRFDGRASNLHRVWDSGLLARRGLSASAYARMLDAHSTSALPRLRVSSAATYAQWAQESCRITERAGFYPARHRISQSYVDTELPVAEERLRIGGYRLAWVLNEVFSAEAAAR